MIIMLMINIIIIAGTEREVDEDDTIILCLLMDFILILLQIEDCSTVERALTLLSQRGNSKHLT